MPDKNSKPKPESDKQPDATSANGSDDVAGAEVEPADSTKSDSAKSSETDKPAISARPIDDKTDDKAVPRKEESPVEQKASSEPKNVPPLSAQAVSKSLPEASPAKQPVAEPAENSCSSKPVPCSSCPKQAEHLWGRRDVLVGIGWGGIAAATLGTCAGLLRFMYPKVLFEPSDVFKAGYPYEYAIGAVDSKWINSERVWVVRTPESIFVLSAICTHLGCTPAWLKSEDKFKCPCHGSGFHSDGINYEGPAPRALERFTVAIGDDGQLVIDKSKKFLYEKDQWEDPGSFLVV